MKCVLGAGRGGPVWRRGAVLRRDAEEEQQVCVADSCCGINAEKSGAGRAEEPMKGSFLHQLTANS